MCYGGLTSFPATIKEGPYENQDDPTADWGRGMDLDVKYYPIVGLSGRMIYVFKLASGSLQDGRAAEEIAEKARCNLKAWRLCP